MSIRRLKSFPVTLWLRPGMFWSWFRLWRSLPVLDWMQAAQHFRQADFRTAGEYYLRGLERYPEHNAASCARLDYSYCLVKLGDLREATRQLYKLCKNDSGLKEPYILLVKVFQYLGDDERALKISQEALNRFPRNASVIAQFAHVVFSFSTSADTIETARGLLENAAQKVAEQDHSAIVIDAARAHYHLKYGDVFLGERLLARVLASGSAPHEAVLIRGQQLLEQGRTIPGRHQLSRSISLTPEDPRPLILLAQSYLHGEDTGEWAVQLATSACQRSLWRNTVALETLVEAKISIGDEESARMFNLQLQSLKLEKTINFDTLRKLELDIERLRSL